MNKTDILTLALILLVSSSNAHWLLQSAIVHSAVISKPYEDASIACAIPKSNKFTCDWSHRDKIVKNDDRHTISVSNDFTNCSLHIKMIKQEDLGTYMCSFIFNNAAVPAIGRPKIEAGAWVQQMGSVTFTVGERARLSCKTWGMPAPLVTWLRYDEETNTTISANTSDGRVTFTSSEGVINAVMYIADVQLTDRATYICNATNIHGTGSNTLLLRVRGKYAFIWPGVGILVQVVLLAVILIVHEANKRRLAAADSATDEAAVGDDAEDEAAAAIATTNIDDYEDDRPGTSANFRAKTKAL